jgi:hypothetical protein
MEIFGGNGNDQFLVYHNKAELKVHGEEGDDKFLVRAFRVLDDSGEQDWTNITTGDGINEITYAINAPVNIEAGAGYDTLVVLMTEYHDHIAITESEIHGAGRSITYAGINRLEIDGLAGDDVFYVLSTAEGVETVLIGHLGSDTFVICGDVPENKVIGEGNTYINFDSSERKTSAIKGKLIIIGGVKDGEDRSLAEAVTLPTETNRYKPYGTVTSSSENTLVEEGANFSENIVGYFVAILDEFGEITQLRQILSVAEDTLPGWTVG